MRTMMAAFGALVLAVSAATPQGDKPAGVALADLSWQEAEPLLTASAVVVIPLGAGSVEYGPQLKLNAGERLARFVAARVQAATPSVVAPPLIYNYFPSYAEYPGSTTLDRTTARDVTVDVVRSLAKHGPRRFYVLNTGGAALGPLSDAAKVLADQGILLGYTDMRYHLQSAQIKREQRDVLNGAPHADEIETSMLLYADPTAVDMKKATAEYGTGRGALTRKDSGTGILSSTGVLGDATVATAEKGRVLIDTLVAGVLGDIQSLRTAPLPIAKTATAPAAALPPRPSQPAETRLPNGCTPSDEREIRLLGSRFSGAWQEMDALKISLLFTGNADMRHPDGTIERTPDLIRQNREQLFQKREFRGSVHPVTLNDVRCLGATFAIADGKWELRYADTSDANRQGRGGAVPTAERVTYAGLCTLVVSRTNGSWQIEAWRYTVNPREGTPPPSILKQPGFIGRGY